MFIIGSSDTPYYEVDCSIKPRTLERHIDGKYPAVVYIPDRDSVSAKVTKSSIFDRCCWVPGLSIITGGLRALAALSHTLWNGGRLVYHSIKGSNLEKDKKELIFGIKQLGLGVLESIPVFGNAIAYNFYRRRIHQVENLAKESALERYSELKRNYTRSVNSRINTIGLEFIKKEQIRYHLYESYSNDEFWGWVQFNEPHSDQIHFQKVANKLLDLYNPKIKYTLNADMRGIAEREE
ncbi:MAG: hypothetical protein WD595_02840 [Waddliaceae bacterium]